MNLIKFKDIIKIGDDVFNTYLKGKYAYWVRMRYVVPFEFMSVDEYIKAEDDVHCLIGTPNKGLDKHYWDLYREDGLAAYVDEAGTDEANNIAKFSRYNKFACDSDITLDEIKKFRTWLATTLLEFDQDSKGRQKNEFYDANTTHMLNYYAMGMYDDVVKALVVFGRNEVGIVDSLANECGCGSWNHSGLYNTKISSCEPMEVYRRNIYEAMCAKFGDIDFWTGLGDIFLAEMKQYIDNILRANLQLRKAKYVSLFNDCPCKDNSEHETAREILRRLSEALSFIISGETAGHINYISTAFRDWANEVYEIMEWN